MTKKRERKSAPKPESSDTKDDKPLDRTICAWSKCNKESETIYRTTLGFCDEHWKTICDSKEPVKTLIDTNCKGEFKNCF